MGLDGEPSFPCRDTRLDDVVVEEGPCVIIVGESDPGAEGETTDFLGIEVEWDLLLSTSRPLLVREHEVVVNLDRLSTILSGEIEGTLAVEAVTEIDAGCSWWATIWFAIRHGLLTVLSSEPLRTNTFVARSIVDAAGSVLTCTLGTGVKLVLTSDPVVVDGAGAVEAGAVVLAASAVHARVPNAAVRSRLTLLPVRARGTDTEVVLEQVDAVSTVLTRG